MIEDIRCSAFDRRPSSKDSIDQEFINHARFLQLAETYKTLKYAVKLADIGLIKRVISVCCLLFEGSRQTNYAFEMLYLFRLISTSTCDDVLQRAILSNSLVNTEGKADTWKEIDIFVEHLNLQLKQLLWARKNSTFDVNRLFEVTALTGEYCAMLAAFLQKYIGHQPNPDHKNKAPADDVHILAYELSERSVCNTGTGKGSSFDSPDYLADGTYRLVTKKRIENFNSRVVQLEEMLQSSAECVPENTGDMPADSQLCDLTVWIILFLLIHLLIYP